MSPIEFETELEGKPFLHVPKDVADRLPKKGHAKVIVMLQDPEDAQWRTAAYGQFLKDDATEDSVYDPE